MNALLALRGLLPARWRPGSKANLTLSDITDAGTLVTKSGRLKAVLRLPTEGLEGGQQTVRALSRLAAAINAGAGHATLLAWGKPNTLAGALQERQERATRFAPGSGRYDLAISQATHLARLADGRPATEDRPARPPVRRTGFYLVVEDTTEEKLTRLTETLCALYGAVRVRGAEAAALEADAWRGQPLPPKAIQVWSDASDSPVTEFYMNRDGAHVREVDPETGRKIKELAPWPA